MNAQQALQFFAIITEDGLDQICYTKADANTEARDLRAMGFKTTVRQFPSEEAVYRFFDLHATH